MPHKLAAYPMEAAADEPWRSMTAEDALRHLVAEDVARRTSAARDEAYGLGLGGAANRKRLVAWRREHGLCAKCGRAIPADELFKHCPKCRKAFRERERRKTLNLTPALRLARAERSRRSYYKLAHGAPPPPKVVAVVAPVVAVVAPVVAPKVVAAATRKQTAAGPKRDRAAYFREYRANRTKS